MNSSNQRSEKRRGFTLVEVLVATTLVVTVLAGVYMVVVHALRLTRMARDHYVATNIAKNRLERARNFQYNDLYLLAEGNVTVNENGLPDNAGRYRRTTVINSEFDEGLTEVSVLVHIRSRRTGQFSGEQEQISSLFTEYEEYTP